MDGRVEQWLDRSGKWRKPVHKEKEITVPHGKDAERTSPPRRYLLKATSAFSKYAAVR